MKYAFDCAAMPAEVLYFSMRCHGTSRHLNRTLFNSRDSSHYILMKNVLLSVGSQHVAIHITYWEPMFSALPPKF